MSRANEGRASQKFSDKQRAASQKAKAEKAARKKIPSQGGNQGTAQTVKDSPEKG